MTITEQFLKDIYDLLYTFVNGRTFLINASEMRSASESVVTGNNTIIFDPLQGGAFPSSAYILIMYSSDGIGLAEVSRTTGGFIVNALADGNCTYMAVLIS